MNCPLCNVSLQLAERQGVEIDYCPKCRGIWLDRGELDKIIERVEQQTPLKSVCSPMDNHYDHERNQKHHGGHHSDKHDRHDHHDHYKRKSFLRELFD